jgi:hypothetical protein
VVVGEMGEIGGMREMGEKRESIPALRVGVSRELFPALCDWF